MASAVLRFRLRFRAQQILPPAVRANRLRIRRGHERPAPNAPRTPESAPAFPPRNSRRPIAESTRPLYCSTILILRPSQASRKPKSLGCSFTSSNSPTRPSSVRSLSLVAEVDYRWRCRFPRPIGVASLSSSPSRAVAEKNKPPTPQHCPSFGRPALGFHAVSSPSPPAEIIIPSRTGPGHIYSGLDRHGIRNGASSMARTVVRSRFPLDPLALFSIARSGPGPNADFSRRTPRRPSVVVITPAGRRHPVAGDAADPAWATWSRRSMISAAFAPAPAAASPVSRSARPTR